MRVSALPVLAFGLMDQVFVCSILSIDQVSVTPVSLIKLNIVARAVIETLHELVSRNPDDILREPVKLFLLFVIIGINSVVASVLYFPRSALKFTDPVQFLYVK